MNFDSLAQILFFSFFTLFIGTFIYRRFKYGSIKAAIFGAPIERTLGEVDGGSGKIMSIKVKVHRLGGDAPDKAIGLEFVAKSLTSYEMMPVTLSVSEAKKLAILIKSAAGGNAA